MQIKSKTLVRTVTEFKEQRKLKELTKLTKL